MKLRPPDTDDHQVLVVLQGGGAAVEHFSGSVDE